MVEGRDSVKRRILALVQRHDGEYYWYQVERFLRADTPAESGPFGVEIDALLTEGLMESRPNPSIDHQSRYWLTEKGRDAIANVADA